MGLFLQVHYSRFFQFASQTDLRQAEHESKSDKQNKHFRQLPAKLKDILSQMLKRNFGSGKNCQMLKLNFVLSKYCQMLKLGLLVALL